MPAVDVSVHGPRVAEAVPLHAEDFLEGIPELGTPTVNERVEGRVCVSYPVQYPEGKVVVLLLPYGHHHVEQKEGQPAQGEDPHDDAQGLKGFVFSQAELGLLLATPIVGLQRVEVAIVAVMETSNALVNLLELALCLLENTAVDKNHDDQRDVEGNDGGGDGVSHVGGELTAVTVLYAPLSNFII